VECTVLSFRDQISWPYGTPLRLGILQLLFGFTSAQYNRGPTLHQRIRCKNRNTRRRFELILCDLERWLWIWIMWLTFSRRKS